MDEKSKIHAPPSSAFLRRAIQFDTAISLRLYNLTHSILPFTLLKSLEISGDGRLFFPIVIGLILRGGAAAINPLLINLFIGAILDLIVIGSLKHLVQRPRPVYNKNMFLSFAVDHWSFPSGHSSRVSFIAAIFYFYSESVRAALLPFEYSRWFFVEYFGVIVPAWAVITSISRVLLGRHFVFDVIAGMCLGVLEGWFVFWGLNYENLVAFFSG